jgi:hypothetical protein
MDTKARIKELTANGMRISEAGKQAHQELVAESNRQMAQVRAREEREGR